MFKIFLYKGVVCRKYWYPLIRYQPVHKNEKIFSLNNALALNKSVICLPLYPDLIYSKIDNIIKIIKEN